MARCLKFRIYEVEGLYYLCSENKGADQLRGDRKADLRLCFRICKNPVFSQLISFVSIETDFVICEMCYNEVIYIRTIGNNHLGAKTWP